MAMKEGDAAHAEGDTIEVRLSENGDLPSNFYSTMDRVCGIGGMWASPQIVLKNCAEYPTNSFTNTCKAIGRKDPAQNISCIHIL